MKRVDGWALVMSRSNRCCRRCLQVINPGRVWHHKETKGWQHAHCGPGLADGSAPSYTPTHEVVLMNEDHAVPQYRLRRLNGEQDRPGEHPRA